jgi:ABC-type transporter MlaC component
MPASGVTRAAAIAGLASMVLALGTSSAYAARNQAAESHVSENANAALRALADRAKPASASDDEFRRIIARMADMQRIAITVLGSYGRGMRDDPALQARWIAAFEDHAVAVYESQLSRYARSQLKVTGSTEFVSGRDVVVHSEMKSPVTGRILSLQWRLRQRDAGWKVLDISFVADGNEIWLAQQQQQEFALQLDRLNGNIDALIVEVRAKTASLRQRRSASE